MKKVSRVARWILALSFALTIGMGLYMFLGKITFALGENTDISIEDSPVAYFAIVFGGTIFVSFVPAFCATYCGCLIAPDRKMAVQNIGWTLLVLGILYQSRKMTTAGTYDGLLIAVRITSIIAMTLGAFSVLWVLERKKKSAIEQAGIIDH